jgi:hypothetical protein
MACSVCGRTGHKKPNCPIVKEEKKEQQQQLITILQTIPLILSNPLVIAGAWLGISKMFPSVNLLNNLIATAEIVPTVDLNVPQGVVLGAMIDKTDDAIDLFNDIVEFILETDINPIPTREEVKEGTVEGAKDIGQFILDFFTPTSDLWQRK